MRTLLASFIAAVLLTLGLYAQAGPHNPQGCQPLPKPVTPSAEAAEQQQLAPASNRSEKLAEVILTQEQAGFLVSDTLMQQALQDGNPNLRMLAAAYPWLSAAGIEVWIHQADTANIVGMLQSGACNITGEQIDYLIDKQNNASPKDAQQDDIFRALLDQHRFALSDAQARHMAGSHDVIVQLALAQRNGDDTAAQQARLALPSVPNAEGAAHMLAVFSRPLPSDIVDLALTNPNPEVRTYLVKYGAFVPTAAQQARILADDDQNVVKALLGHHDITLTQAQIQTGAATDDADIGAWWWLRPEYHPTAAQIEAALSSPSVGKRLFFAARDQWTPNATQTERGLSDADATVRNTFARRQDVKLTEAQLERCSQDRDFAVRNTCVQRDDYVPNLQRFNRALLDDNANILMGFIRSCKTHGQTDFTAWIDADLDSDDPRVLRALAENPAQLPMNEQELIHGSDSLLADVQRGFGRQMAQQHKQPQLQ